MSDLQTDDQLLFVYEVTVREQVPLHSHKRSVINATGRVACTRLYSDVS